jgi:uncharacterized protein
VGERTSHPSGSFSWTDLGAADAEAAKRFYGGLFGWSFDDMPIPDDGFYSMALSAGKRAAAIYTMQAEQPPAWLSYVTVEDADAAASRARDLGATTIQEPFDVMEAGRMAVLQDPTGAVFAVWQPRESIGATIVNGPGALSLNQLNTTDPQRAQDFYRGLFGWRSESVGGDDQPYWGLFIGERVNGGMMPLPPGAGAPPHWLVYFGIDEIDAAAERITELRGTVMVPTTPVPGGEILVAHDPQGAVFGLFAGRFDD